MLMSLDMSTMYAMACQVGWWAVIGIAVLTLIFMLLPFLLALITVLRQRRRSSDEHHQHSALYAGRVWHTRYRPTKHAFTYPLFLFVLDLEECEKDDGALFRRKLWPLSLIINFHDRDHLKNGEGLLTRTEKSEKQQRLSDRIYRLVAEKTKQAFRPTLATHRILLATHLTYYGYCFNPVSFYYIQNVGTGQTDAVVAEVSNTPWNEMYCYVLHEKSIDHVTVKSSSSDEILSSSTQRRPIVNYVFPKTFHVSPFMEMEYKYDWIFDQQLNVTAEATTTSSNNATMHVISDMRRADNDVLQFRARFTLDRKSLHPFRAAWHVATFPVYCALIQIWIHYEAFWLFCKGVEYQEHPDGTETAASKIIADIMTPLFALQDMLQKKTSQVSSSNGSSNSAKEKSS